MNAIQRKRLLKLADFLDQLPPQKFDFDTIAVEGAKPHKEALKARKESCGTTACAIGWMPVVFPRLTRWVRTPCYFDSVAIHIGPAGRGKARDFEVAEQVFGLTEQEAEWLFLPDATLYEHSDDLWNTGCSIISPCGSDATAKQVARHIRKFVKHGLPKFESV
jgi:hypothetical protein